MKDVWRSILAYGQAMERAVSTEQNGNRPHMREVLSFLSHAYELPVLPEDCFGPRHVCVERITECFHSLLDHVLQARASIAELLDFMYQNEQGIDLDALGKLLDDLPQTCPLQLEEEVLLHSQLKSSLAWQQRVNELSSSCDNVDGDDDLLLAINLVREARAWVVRSRGVVELEKRIEKAMQLEEKVQEWERACTGTVKNVSALIKEAARISLASASVRRLLKFNRELEMWVDRANVAIRSRISLSEIESLMSRAESMPLCLDEFLEKLRSRVQLARAWIQELELEVPRVSTEGTEAMSWMKDIRHALMDEKKDGTYNRLMDLCAEATRIPVEMGLVKMLQIEIEAKSWRQKAEKWIPRNGDDGRKGKIEDIRDHLEKAQALRDGLPVENRQDWFLEYEDDLKAIVDSADKWFDDVSTELTLQLPRVMANELIMLSASSPSGTGWSTQ
jgi:hypothetical protein